MYGRHNTMSLDEVIIPQLAYETSKEKNYCFSDTLSKPLKNKCETEQKVQEGIP